MSQKKRKAVAVGMERRIQRSQGNQINQGRSLSCIVNEHSVWHSSSGDQDRQDCPVQIHAWKAQARTTIYLWDSNRKIFVGLFFFLIIKTNYCSMAAGEMSGTMTLLLITGTPLLIIWLLAPLAVRLAKQGGRQDTRWQQAQALDLDLRDKSWHIHLVYILGGVTWPFWISRSSSIK